MTKYLKDKIQHNNQKSCPRLLIAAMSSGSGKTTITCGILQALKNRGLQVAACKCGPDYIDPMFHKKAIGIPSKNIDLFFSAKEMATSLLTSYMADKDILITEGVMGYYDGLSMTSIDASSYDVAKTFGMPVVLVVNAKGMARSIIPMIKGMMDYQEDSNIQGVILNNVSKMVYQGIAPLIEKELGIKVLGYLPHQEDIQIDSRHLGLVTPDQIKDIQDRLQKLADLLEETMDIDSLLTIAKKAGVLEQDKVYEINIPKAGMPLRIAYAKDEAFCFYYQDNLDVLKNAGCELIPFSPIHDEALPIDIDGLILGGGYPELYTKELSDNLSMRADILSRLEDGLVTHAECGGFMYLHDTMENQEKEAFQMVGFLKAQAIKGDKLVRFGYINLEADRENDFLKKGQMIKAHEFHYWDSTDNGEVMHATKPRGNRSFYCCKQQKNTFMGYPHLFYYSNLSFVENFLKLCEKYHREKKR